MVSMLDLDALIDSIVARPDLLARLGAALGGEVEEYVTVPRAAEMLGVSEKTVRNWLSAGRLQKFGAPRRRLVLRAEIEMEQGRNSGATFRGRVRHR